MCACIFGTALATAVANVPGSVAETPAADVAAAVPPSTPSDPCQGATRFEEQETTADAHAPAESSIRLLSITPTADTPVDEGTVLQAELAYSVRDFQPGQFKIMAQFDTEMNMTTDGSFKNYPIPPAAAGKLHFCFPLRDIWNVPNMKRPLTVHFMLNRVYAGGLSREVARTANVVFISSAAAAVPSDPRAALLERYAVALNRAHSLFEQFAADNQFCSNRRPDRAAETRGIYERWESKYARIQSEVNELFMKWLTERTGGDRRAAQQIAEDFKRAATANASSGSDEQLQSKCEKFSLFLAGPKSDPETLLASDLATIRRGVN